MKDVIVNRISFLRKLILIHSYLYYYIGFNVIEDYEYDNYGRELIDLQNRFVDEAKAANYAHEFKDYTGSCYSGFNLDYKKPEIISAAERLM